MKLVHLLNKKSLNKVINASWECMNNAPMKKVYELSRTIHGLEKLSLKR